MNSLHSLSDDFYINMTLSTEMDLPTHREAVLHYFERLQKTYPTMRNFYCREKGDFVLEEEKDGGQYRWAAIEQRRVCSGQVNPENAQAALEQHQLVLDLCPYMLSVSPLDCESLDLLYGFDFNYRGNHNRLIAEALGMNSAFEKMSELAAGAIIHYEPSFTFAVDPNCRLQCRVNIEARTNAYQIRTGDYLEDQLSVYLTARQYGSLEPGCTYVDALNRLDQLCTKVLDDYVIDHVLKPLARTIAMR